jgi:hypothetical protein
VPLFEIINNTLFYFQPTHKTIRPFFLFSNSSTCFRKRLMYTLFYMKTSGLLNNGLIPKEDILLLVILAINGLDLIPCPNELENHLSLNLLAKRQENFPSKVFYVFSSIYCWNSFYCYLLINLFYRGLHAFQNKQPSFYSKKITLRRPTQTY